MEQSSCQCPLDMDAHEFCRFLSEDLKKLEETMVDTSISLRRCAEAMRFMMKMHVELLILLKKRELPLSFGAKECWLDQYMKETVVMLDLCNLLKAALSGITRYRMAVDFATQELHKESTATIMGKIEFETSDGEREQYALFSRWNRMNGVVENSAPWTHGKFEHKDPSFVMVAVKSTMYIISLLLVSAFSFSSSCSSSSSSSSSSCSSSSPPVFFEEGQLLHKAPQLQCVMTSLVSLITRSGVGLVEQEMVEEVVGDLKSQLVDGKVEDTGEFLKNVELLRKRSLILQEGLDLFGAVVDEAFDVVMNGRNEMLRTLRGGDDDHGLR